MLVEIVAQGCCYLKWQAPPASRQQTIFPTPLRCRYEACRPWIVVIGKRFHDSSSTALEVHQSVVITGRSSHIKFRIPVRTSPADGRPYEQMIGCQRQVALIG